MQVFNTNFFIYFFYIFEKSQDGSVNGGLKLKYYLLDPFLHVLSHVLKYNGQKTSKDTRRTREV